MDCTIYNLIFFTYNILYVDPLQILDPRKPTLNHTKNLLTKSKFYPCHPRTHASTYLRDPRKPRNLADSHMRNIRTLIISLNIFFFLFHEKEHVFSKTPEMYWYVIIARLEC